MGFHRHGMNEVARKASACRSISLTMFGAPVARISSIPKMQRALMLSKIESTVVLVTLLGESVGGWGPGRTAYSTRGKRSISIRPCSGEERSARLCQIPTVGMS